MLFMLILISTALGLLIGSFLNVVVYRLPHMLQQAWRNECSELLNIKTPAELSAPENFNLCLPRSHCPQCKKQLTWQENIPLLSYLLLRGKCAHCQQAISWRYPALEFSSAVISLLMALHFTSAWPLLAALIFSWSLLALVFIDIEQQLLPDIITLPLLWLGLLCSLFYFFTDPASAIIGAMTGYTFLWLIAWLFYKITKKVGMGHGDFKLFALLGAWLGWQLLLPVLLLASLLGAAVGMSLIVLKKQSRYTPIPFGPFLAFAGGIALLWGNKLSSAWFALTT
jgi:leader peptidase (prepilin peptidase)/N-methyltransferase